MDLGAFDRGYGEYLSRVQFDVKADDDVALESRIALILQMAEVQHSSVVVYDFYKQAVRQSEG